MRARGGTKGAPRAPGPARGRCCPPWAAVGNPPLSPCWPEGLGLNLVWALSDALSLPYRNSAAAESRQLLPGKLAAMLGDSSLAMLGDSSLPASAGQEGFPCHSRVQERAGKARQRDKLPSSRVPFLDNSPFVTGSESFLSISPPRGRGLCSQGDTRSRAVSHSRAHSWAG